MLLLKEAIRITPVIDYSINRIKVMRSYSLEFGYENKIGR